MREKRIFAIIIFSIFIAVFNTYAQYELFSENNSVGLRRSNNEKIILNGSFDSIGWNDGSLVKDRLIKAKKNGLWALYTSGGKAITNHEYTSIKPYARRQFIVSKKDNGTIFQLWGTISSNGNEIIPVKHITLEQVDKHIITTEKVANKYYKGLYNSKGEQIIESRYSDIQPISKNHFAINLHGELFALFNSDGIQLSDFNFENIETLNDSLFSVTYYDRKGLIDLNGDVRAKAIHKEIIIQDNYFDLLPFNSWDLFINGAQHSFYFDEVHPLGEDLYVVRTNNHISVINIDEKYLQYLRDHEINTLSRNFVSIKNTGDGRIGVINKKGEIALPILYDSVVLAENIFFTQTIGEKETRWFSHNVAGAKINRLGYQKIGALRGGYFKAEKDGKWGLISPLGEELTYFKYSKIEDLSENDFRVYADTLQGIINNKGQIILEAEYSEVDKGIYHYNYRNLDRYGLTNFNGRIVANSTEPISELPGGYYQKEDDGYTVYNYDGSKVYDRVYDTVRVMNERQWLLKRDNLHFLYSPEDQMQNDITKGIQYLGEFNENYIPFYKDNEWGFIDDFGEMRVANRYADVGYFSEGYSAVKLIGNWGMIDKNETLVIQPEYDSIAPFYNGMTWVRRDGKEGLINKLGDNVLELKYDKLTRYEDWMKLELDNLVGLADKSGRLIREPFYQDISQLSPTYYKTFNGNAYGVIDLKGSDIVPILYDGIKIEGDRIFAEKKGKWTKLYLK